MVQRATKLNALRHIAMAAGDPGLIPVLAFLAGRLDRVHFVEDLGEAEVAVHLSLNRRLWPRTPFRSQVDGATITNPIMFIDIVALRDVDVFVRVDLGLASLPSGTRTSSSRLCQGRRAPWNAQSSRSGKRSTWRSTPTARPARVWKLPLRNSGRTFALWSTRPRPTCGPSTLSFPNSRARSAKGAADVTSPAPRSPALRGAPFQRLPGR